MQYWHCSENGGKTDDGLHFIKRNYLEIFDGGNDKLKTVAHSKKVCYNYDVCTVSKKSVCCMKW